MRWLTCFILGYLALGLQMGAQDVRFHGGVPSLALLVVVFICLSSPRNLALMASFLIGLTQDTLSQHPAGLYALSYGLTALIVCGTSQVVYRQHPLTQAALTLSGGLITAMVLTLHAVLYPPASAGEAGSILSGLRDASLPLLISALYTAILSPGVLWLLFRIRGLAPRGPVRRAWG